jgi:hypothetical protein
MAGIGYFGVAEWGEGKVERYLFCLSISSIV